MQERLHGNVLGGRHGCHNEIDHHGHGNGRVLKQRLDGLVGHCGHGDGWLLNQRLDAQSRRIIPDFSFGGSFSEFIDIYKNATGMGDYNAVRIRKGNKSVTVSNETPKDSTAPVNG